MPRRLIWWGSSDEVGIARSVPSVPMSSRGGSGARIGDYRSKSRRAVLLRPCSPMFAQCKPAMAGYASAAARSSLHPIAPDPRQFLAVLGCSHASWSRRTDPIIRNLRRMPLHGPTNTDRYWTKFRVDYPDREAAPYFCDAPLHLDRAAGTFRPRLRRGNVLCRQFESKWLGHRRQRHWRACSSVTSCDVCKSAGLACVTDEVVLGPVYHWVTTPVNCVGNLTCACMDVC